MKNYEHQLTNLVEHLLDSGVIALQYCCSESGENGDIEHYQLLEPGQVGDSDCFNSGEIPVISNTGKEILSQYLLENTVKLYPEKFLPVWSQSSASLN